MKGPAMLSIPHRPNLPFLGRQPSPTRVLFPRQRQPWQLPPLCPGTRWGLQGLWQACHPAPCRTGCCSGAGDQGWRSQLWRPPAQSRQGREAALRPAARTRLSERVWSVKSNKASRRSPGSAAACRPRPHHAPEAAHYGGSRSPELHVCYDLTLRDMK